jgi:hypothetical protein
LKFSPEQIKAAEERSSLKRLSTVDENAEAFLSIARNSGQTGAIVTVDCGDRDRL